MRRHYIAKYALNHVDSQPVDIAWSSEGSIIACYQGGGFAQIDIKNRTVPLEGIERQVMGWNHQGELAYAIDTFKQGEIPFDDLYVVSAFR